MAGTPQRRLLRQPLLHADPPHVHPAVRRLPIEAHADVGVVAQRRPRVGAGEAGRDSIAGLDSRGRARLLPRAAVPELRQPGATRHLVAGRQAGRRLGPRRRAAEERRVPRLLGRDRPARVRRRVGALLEPVRDVRADHGREPDQGADADLSRLALHDGRAVGRLRADDHRARPVLRRRGELLRPRRQPPRRLRADAGPGRWLLRAAVHDQQLPRPDAQQAGARQRPPGVRRGRECGSGAVRGVPVDRRHPVARPLPPGARQDRVGLLRHGAHGRGPREGALGDPGAVRRVQEGSAGHRRRRERQPDAREGRPGRGLLRAGDGDVPRPRWTAARAAAATSAPSTRTRRARRSATTTTSPTSAPGSGPATR